MKLHLRSFLFALIGALTATLIALLHSGFCFVELRWVSDAELIRAAASLAMTHNQIYRETNAEFYTPSNPKPYASVDEFLSTNPDCCRLIDRPEDHEVTAVFERLLGQHRRTVEVNYNVRYTNPFGRLATEPARLQVPVNHCGHACFDC